MAGSDSQDLEMPRQAIILAAGRGSQLRPYTDEVPTALIEVAEQPMVLHSLQALRQCGVERFLICRGWLGEAFDEYLAMLGEGVTLLDCPDYATTGMLKTLQIALPYLEDGGFYVVYGDVIFRQNVARQLSQSRGIASIIVNSKSPGTQAKGITDVEIVVASGEGSSSAVQRIGKGRCTNMSAVSGEFGGIVKFNSLGHTAVEKVVKRLYQAGYPNTPSSASKVPWWLEPVEKAGICDLLQLLIDEGTDITPVKIFGGWHELNTPQDLTRLRNDTSIFLSEDEVRSQVSAMGACFLSEANDLKRPLPIVAKELNVELPRLESLVRGDLDLGDALDILRKMSEVYPVPLNDLWMDADDTMNGVRICKADASKASARILDRKDRTGKRTPYYEYRDAAMSRCSQFRPEWIKELRVVTSGDPCDPDIAMNNGHLMMQTTLFIGPVDFLWVDRFGVTQRRAMNTGDSNFISPFVPHTFTVREKEREGVIIAVTYGGRVRRAFTEFSRVGAKRVAPLAGDKRDPKLLRRCILQRNLEAECMSRDFLVAKVAPHLSEARVVDLLSGEEGTYEELEILAKVLNVQLSDLLDSPLEIEEEVVVTRTEDSHEHARRTATYTLAPLARSRHQPDLKTFDVEVLDSATPGETLSCGLHCFIYHFGTEPIEVTWGEGDRTQTTMLDPGDSIYIAPLVKHSFSVPSERQTSPRSKHNVGTACAKGRRLYIVRIPGHLSGETLSEFATFSASGKERAGGETKQWYS